MLITIEVFIADGNFRFRSLYPHSKEESKCLISLGFPICENKRTKNGTARRFPTAPPHEITERPKRNSLRGRIFGRPALIFGVITVNVHLMKDQNSLAFSGEKLLNLVDVTFSSHLI